MLESGIFIRDFGTHQEEINLVNSGTLHIKVSVNENFSTLLDFVFFLFWHEWVLNFILAEKENQKVLFNPSKMSLS